jgi:hypothetical protein
MFHSRVSEFFWAMSCESTVVLHLLEEGVSEVLRFTLAIRVINKTFRQIVEYLRKLL